MLVLFGQNSYCRQVVIPEDLGLATGYVDCFELTQQYAHVYEIPFFPVGESVWMVRTSQGELQHINNPEHEYALGNVESSWITGLRAWTGLLLAFALALLMYMHDVIYNFI